MKLDVKFVEIKKLQYKEKNIENPIIKNMLKNIIQILNLKNIEMKHQKNLI